MDDKKLVKWLLLLLLLPLVLAYFSGDRYRYPCQDPANWDKAICQKPLCDVNRTCPEHIFKGQRDPRLGPPDESNKTTTTPNPSMGFGNVTQGANCGK
jgi:hypothetical protein